MRALFCFIFVLLSTNTYAQHIELDIAGGVTMPTVRETAADRVTARGGGALMTGIYGNIPLGRSGFFIATGSRLNILSFNASQYKGVYTAGVNYRKIFVRPSLNVLVNYLVPIQPGKAIRIALGAEINSSPGAGYEAGLSYTYHNFVTFGARYYLPVGNTYSTLTRFGVAAYMLELKFVMGKRDPYSFFKTRDED